MQDTTFLKGAAYGSFLADLIAAVERTEVDGAPLGSRWDVEGDPHASLLARLWASVADSVAAYAELTAGESYLPTARDWTDLRRLAALVGYRARAGVAAQGWVVAEVDRGADPVVPAGTRVQAPATPARPAQTFEAADDTPLHAEWDGLTATWVPAPAKPDRRELRFLGSPGLRAGDQLLFVREVPPSPPPIFIDWLGFWSWVLLLWYHPPSGASALSVATVTGSTQELGTTVVGVDRDLDTVLDSLTDPYAAYRILDTAAPAKRLRRVLRIPLTGGVDPLDVGGPEPIDPAGTSIVLDAPLETLSAGQLVAVVDWQTRNCDIAHVKSHEPIGWEIVPGTARRASKLTFDSSLPALLSAGAEKSIYVLDRRVVARHYVFPAARPAGLPQLRLYPRPTRVPDRVAVDVGTPERADWAVFECRSAVAQENPGAAGDAPSGLIVDLLDGAPGPGPLQARASGNVVRVRHGTTKRVTLGSGDATVPFQRVTTPDAPIAHDVDDAGDPVPTLLVRVDGLRWDERESLYAAGPATAFTATVERDGAVTLEFGDGERGARLPSGRNNVSATYRVGGGRAGEVESGAIDTLVGSVRGVRKVRGAGPTAGGADQDDERRLRRLAPARARVLGRAVSLEDLADLSLDHPGVSHAVAYTGGGPPGCACGGTGLHVAALRYGTAGPRAPLPAELRALSDFLDARRDVTVPLCVSAGVVTRPALSAVLAVDPRRDPGAVCRAAAAALADPDGPLAPDDRSLGRPLDRSDVLAVLHGVTGVVGVTQLTLAGASGELGRLAAARYELVFPADDPQLTGAAA
jgi:hypothetical protein